jgi:hypothetical protein
MKINDLKVGSLYRIRGSGYCYAPWGAIYTKQQVVAISRGDIFLVVGKIHKNYQISDWCMFFLPVLFKDIIGDMLFYKLLGTEDDLNCGKDLEELK